MKSKKEEKGVPAHYQVRFRENDNYWEVYDTRTDQAVGSSDDQAKARLFKGLFNQLPEQEDEGELFVNAPPLQRRKLFVIDPDQEYEVCTSEIGGPFHVHVKGRALDEFQLNELFRMFLLSLAEQDGEDFYKDNLNSN